MFVHQVVRFDGAVLVQLNLNAVLAIQLAVRKVWVSFLALFRPVEVLVKEVHSVDIGWCLLSAVELNVAIETSSVPDSSNERAANIRLTIVVLP